MGRPAASPAAPSPAYLRCRSGTARASGRRSSARTRGLGARACATAPACCRMCFLSPGNVDRYCQQSMASRRSRHASPIFSVESRVMRCRNIARGSVCRLSKFATQRPGMPSSRPSGNSLITPRTVRVHAATTTALIRSATGSRVRTRTGRSPPGVCAHQTSPLTKPGSRPTTPGRSQRQSRHP
jgi:hypothetical protein